MEYLKWSGISFHQTLMFGYFIYKLFVDFPEKLLYHDTHSVALLLGTPVQTNAVSYKSSAITSIVLLLRHLQSFIM